jgi:hypothetical protein
VSDPPSEVCPVFSCSSGSLAEWLDPDLRYSHLEDRRRNFVLNTDFKAYDEEGRLVDPALLEQVFFPGVFVQADVRLKL